MKIGLVVAAAIVVLRIILEQAGAPEAVNNIFGVAWLYFLMPILFANAIAASDHPRPYKALLKDVLLFGVFTRLMVMVTYMLAYALRWSAPRFVNVERDFVQGFFLIPIGAALIWILMATAIGMIIGSIVFLVKRKKPAPAPAA
jgi:hypothetical protein